MALLEWPSDLFPYSVAFYLQPHVGGSESPLTRTRKTYGLSKPRWVCRLRFRGGYDGFSGHEAYGPQLDAFITEMQGGLNTVNLWDFRRPYPIALTRYYAQFAGESYTFDGGETFSLGEQFYIPSDAEPMNETAALGATSIVFAGFLPGERVFNRGDYFGGDGRAHLIQNDATADVDGNALVNFQPPLKSALLAGNAVTMRPKTPFQLVNSDDAGQNESEVGQLVEYVLDFVEDIS